MTQHQIVTVGVPGPGAEDVLLATDGLHAVADPSALTAALTGGETDLDALTGSLVDLALAVGGPDNVGVALARV